MKNARSKPKKEWGNVFEWLRGVLGGEEAGSREIKKNEWEIALNVWIETS